MTTTNAAETIISTASTTAPATRGHNQDSSSLTFAALLEALDYRDTEHVSVCREPPGGDFAATVVPVTAAADFAAGLGDGQSVWFGVNPTMIPTTIGARGTSVQVTRLAALCIDLDVKPGACADLATAEKIIDLVSILLGQRPTAVIYSGHGLQPIWAVEDGDILEEFTTADATSLLRRFGRLVAHVAEEHHQASVDNVFDTARVLRVPGTVNHKGAPVPTGGRLDIGGPLTIAEIDERLTEQGVDAQPDDVRDDEQESDPSDWTGGTTTCHYCTTIIAGLPNDVPRNGARNPWACSQAVRLHCALRLGCITSADFNDATVLLRARLESLLTSTEPRRPMRRYEMRDIMRLGRTRAASKTDAEAWAELGNHGHQSVDDFWGTGSPGVNGAVVQDVSAPVAETRAQEISDARPFYAHKLLTRSDLRALPDPEPLIDNVLDQGTTALLYGKWGTAKTFIAWDWAASVATARPWQGRATAQRRVLYVVAEGAFGFKGRTQAWETGWHRSIGDEWLSILPTPINLMNATDRANLYALVSWGGYGFVVIDTLARCMVGGDENSARDCGVVVEALTYAQANTPGGRGVVLGVHHAGKDGKTLRGSSAFESGADTVYFTSKEDAVIGLSRQKRKDGPENDSHLLKLDPVPGTDSCTLKAASSVSLPGETTDRTATLRLIASQYFVSTGATTTELRSLAVDDGPMTRSTFYRALNELAKSGDLINTGTEKRPHWMVRDE